ncbi:MAG: hypothetical protein COB35_13815 [Gammaproteobacteria bacterium]|nr:MAG: hypothetical protein COB35_13815 [Gammaproteobacteria bacterium]
MLKIGELAKRCGLSVRALRHYDEVGLLVPSGRSESGYRLYCEQNIRRLQHILLLKQLGFSLKKIIEMLNNKTSSLSQTIDEHIAFTEQTIKLQNQLLTQLKFLQDKFSRGKSVVIDDYLATMEMMKMYDKYFNDEQLEQFAKRRTELGADKLNELQEHTWPDLIIKVKQAIADGVAVDSDEAKLLAAKWMKLANMFTQGDSEISAGIGKMYQQEKSLQEKTGISPQVMEFISQAWQNQQS